METDRLFDLWQANKDRPAWVRNARDELNDAVETEDPIPDTESLFEIRQWLDRYKGTVTRQLSDAEDGEDTTTTGDEGGDE